MTWARHQMPARAGRGDGGRGEAALAVARDEARDVEEAMTVMGSGSTAAAPVSLLEAALDGENMRRAWRRVRANKGAAGVDGRDIRQSAQWLRTHWPAVKAQLLAGRYRPQPVRRVVIDKPDGGQRELGIPTVVDRLIQQALLQVLQPIIDPTFSAHSYGFRPERSARQAVCQARDYVNQGWQVVVDVDLEKFFDRVNHDVLLHRLSRHVSDAAVLRLIRAYLRSGIMIGDVLTPRERGTPQGGPLSPLLANVLLDEVDKELEHRGHQFVRYADDCNVYVRSRKAGDRVMAMLRRLYERLHLSVNDAKSAVAEVSARQFLGYSLTVSDGRVHYALAPKTLQRFKARVRQITARSRGCSLTDVVDELRRFLPGWREYFALARHSNEWRALDPWIRRRLRCFQLKQWKTARRAYEGMIAYGASPSQACAVACRMGSWWRASHGPAINAVLGLAHFDRLGVPRLS